MNFDVQKLKTHAENTWCLGCGDFGILTAANNAIKELIEEGYEYNKFTMVAGIGCHGKIFDYININGFYSIHGRVLPTAIGIKLANPELTVIGFAGDGDMYAEGLDHLIHTARYNPDISIFIHNNQVFALTTGQATPTTNVGYKGKTTPEGKWDEPLNPIKIALASGATFVARGYAYDVKHLTWLMKEAIRHKGFAFVDVIQPCITFHNITPYVRERLYRLEESGHDPTDFNQAWEKASEWDYNMDPDAKIPVGIFYRIEKPTMEEELKRDVPFYRIKRERDVREILRSAKVV